MRHGTLSRPILFCASLLSAAMLAAGSGCAMCCAPYDCDYGYTGGAWVRDNPSWGRVGSIFEPAGYKQLDETQETADGQPTQADPNREPAIQNVDPENPGPDAQPDMTPMPNVDPAPMPAPPGSISAPRMRPVRNYLPNQ